MKKLLFLVVAAGFIAAGPPAAAQETIKIGLMCPLTGSWAAEGQDMKQIVQLLAGQVNNRGGLLGKNVDIVIGDDGGDPRTAALAAQRLATRDVSAVIGTYGSSITEASQNIYASAGIVQIANGSTAVRLTEKDLPYFFRTCPRDDEQARVAVKTLMENNYEQIAILHDNTTYAKGLADETKKLLDDKKAEVVFFNALTPGEQDYTTILTKLKSVNPDMVFFTGYYPEAAMLLRQKRDMGWDAPFIGGDANNNPDLVKIAGKEAAAGFRFLSPPVPQDLPSEQARDFLSSYREKYGSAPGSIWAVLAGDAFRVIVKAIEETGSTDTDKLADYLHNDLEAFPGLTGPIAFNEKGDRVGDVYRVYKVNAEGSFVLQE
ncbi:MAG: branched-chain amino acid ABC transporter substrate-binding protein [Desulfobacterales bacterium]|nr:branched-chain amino acid ABC transporter substrate-binding protein [Desulfobacterales bacterium]MBS3754327.1 branched-chain amino acid ABC transporter substrate-binding protein [Desulfobacterales bacterium]